MTEMILALFGMQAAALLGIGGLFYRLGAIGAAHEGLEMRVTKLEVMTYGKA